MEFDETALGNQDADTEDNQNSEEQGADTAEHLENGSPVSEGTEETAQHEEESEATAQEAPEADAAAVGAEEPVPVMDESPASDEPPAMEESTAFEPEAGAEEEPVAATDAGEDVDSGLEEPAEAADEPSMATEPDSGDDEPEAHPMEALLDAESTKDPIQRGEIVEGTVVRAASNEVLIDIGAKTEGMIPHRELERMSAEKIEGMQSGDTLMVFVITPEDRSGNVLVSLERAEEEKDWINAEQFLADGQAYEGSISSFNKGGLIVRFGQLRGFVPASQVSIDRRRRATGATPEERWGEMQDEPIVVKVIEIDKERNRLILSERAASKESRAARKSALLDDLQVNQMIKGRVISLTDFGAFVDIGGADGLVHLSELSWGHVTHPSEVVAIGDDVEVEIINIDRERQRIGLSLKRGQDDPWVEMVQQYEVGQLVQGTVTKLTKFGAFARLVKTPEIEGLIHISELSESRVNHPADVVDENEILTLRIVRIDSDRRRIGLSLKRVDSEAYMDDDWRTMVDTDDVPAAAPHADEDVAAVAKADADAPADTDATSEAEPPVEDALADTDVEATEDADDAEDASDDEEPAEDSDAEDAVEESAVPDAEVEVDADAEDAVDIADADAEDASEDAETDDTADDAEEPENADDADTDVEAEADEASEDTEPADDDADDTEATEDAEAS